MSDRDQFPSSEGTWEKLSRVAVPGAEYDSPERQPHPKCLEGTRVDLLKFIDGLLDNQKESRIIWLHGTAGVGKSAVAFTMAQRMRALKVTEVTKIETRLAGTFFFSRKHTKRSTSGYFFATLAYQLASNFPSVQKDVNKAIRENPAVLDPDKSLSDQMKALFRRPLWHLRDRLVGCLPPVFVIDALDECEPKVVADLISLLGEALRDPELPVIHILLTSRLGEDIRKAIHTREMRPLVSEIPVNTSGEGIAATISLDGADVDNDIYTFLQHSFQELQNRHPDFPQPSMDQLARLANRAGRRFIVATTMINFIDNRDDDPRDRLQLMLELTNDLLPGTEVYELYDRILSTCTDPQRAHQYLSVVSALADPLPISQISKLLGPGKGNDVEKILLQLRSVIDIPADGSLPVNIYHSSLRDYVSDPSNCKQCQVYSITSTHALLAHSSLRLMIYDKTMAASTALLDALLELQGHSEAMQANDPQSLQQSLAFIIEPPEPLHVLQGLLWLRGCRGPGLRSWLGALDGRAWLQTPDGKEWLQTQEGKDWLITRMGEGWLQTRGGQAWLQAESGQSWLHSGQGRLWTHRLLDDHKRQDWLKTRSGKQWLQSQSGQEWLTTKHGGDWLKTGSGREWDETENAQMWLLPHGGCEWLQSNRGQEWLRTGSTHMWLETGGGQEWLHTGGGKEWLQTGGGREWLQTGGGQEWLQTHGGREWLQTREGQEWLRTREGREWLQTREGQEWLQTDGGQEWLQTGGGGQWLRTGDGREWLQTHEGREWPQTHEGREWPQTHEGREWLQTHEGREWLQTHEGREWLQTREGQEWLQTSGVHKWLETDGGREWLQTYEGREWLQTREGREWLQTSGVHKWLETDGGREWLQTGKGQEWLQTSGVHEWLETDGGRQWLWTGGGLEWLQTRGGRELFQTSGGGGWLQTRVGREWLQTRGGREWLQTGEGRQWLQTGEGRQWLQTGKGQEWLHTGEGQGWFQTGEGRKWLQTGEGREWLQTGKGQEWLQTSGAHEWLETDGGREWLQACGGQEWLQTSGVHTWLESSGGRKWLQTSEGREWLQTSGAHMWLETSGGREWLQASGVHMWLETGGGREWLQTRGGREWLQTNGVHKWLDTSGGQEWLETGGGREWLQTSGGREWLQTQSGREWLRTPHGQAWQLTPAASVWVTLEDFLSTLEAISDWAIISDLPSVPAFKVIQQFRSLPDFLMFPVFLALRPQAHPTPTLLEVHLLPDMEIIHAMTAFVILAGEALERRRSASDAFKYACQNWAFHLAQAPDQWDESLHHIFKVFWDHHLFPWLEAQWCLKGLQSCLGVLSKGQQLAKEHPFQAPK